MGASLLHEISANATTVIKVKTPITMLNFFIDCKVWVGVTIYPPPHTLNVKNLTLS